MRRVLVVNGPNLDLLGTRRPDVYGLVTLADLERLVREWGTELGLDVETFQSNHEGELVERVHAAREGADAIVVNPGALTHYSRSLADAIEAVEIPTVEVHISNVAEREPWRRHSVISPLCLATIFGRGVDGYRWALRRLASEGVATSRLVGYGPLTAHRADLRVGSEGAPLAIFVPGGFWRIQWDRDTIDPIAADLARRGFTTLTVSYRRVGSGGEWPGALHDVCYALDWARSRLGADPRRVVVVGHSVGAQLALLASRRAARSGAPPSLVVSLAGVTDLVAAAADGLGDGAVTAFLAGADPAVASPAHLLPVAAPLLVAWSADDDVVPASFSARFAEHAEAAGDRVETLSVEGDHFTLLDPRRRAWRAVAEAIDRHL